MAVDLFIGLCSGLGYQADRVLSVRVTARKVVVAFVDEAGDLKQAVHPLPVASMVSGSSPAGSDDVR